MQIQKTVCNLVWIDDEIDTLITDSKKHLLRREGFKLVGVARTYQEFTQVMDNCYDRVDAVITDANFNKSSLEIKGERDFSGFVKVRECINFYNTKRDIPFYLFTGRRDTLSDKCDDGELDYFEINQRYFNKGEFEEMLQQIRKDVEHINSPSFRIRKKYGLELNAASRLEGNEEALFSALLYEEVGNWDSIQNQINPLRKILERIWSACKKEQIIPPTLTLNGIVRFLTDEDNSYQIKSEVGTIMPQPLCQSLEFFLKITQDGSHSQDGLKLCVDQYIREAHSINLFRALLPIAMELCLWFDHFTSQRKDNAPCWAERSFDEQNIECTGVVKKLEQGDFVVKNYFLQYPKNGEYKEGDTIAIKESIDSKKCIHYLDHDSTITTDRFVPIKHIRIIIKGSNESNAF